MADLSRGAACNLCGTAASSARDSLWTKDGHEIVRCPSCALVFRLELPSDADLTAIYGPAYFSGDHW